MVMKINKNRLKLLIEKYLELPPATRMPSQFMREHTEDVDLGTRIAFLGTILKYDKGITKPCSKPDDANKPDTSL